jgi:hypothetical protein
MNAYIGYALFVAGIIMLFGLLFAIIETEIEKKRRQLK